MCGLQSSARFFPKIHFSSWPAVGQKFVHYIRMLYAGWFILNGIVRVGANIILSTVPWFPSESKGQYRNPFQKLGQVPPVDLQSTFKGFTLLKGPWFTHLYLEESSWETKGHNISETLFQSSLSHIHCVPISTVFFQEHATRSKIVKFSKLFHWANVGNFILW